MHPENRPAASDQQENGRGRPVYTIRRHEADGSTGEEILCFFYPETRRYSRVVSDSDSTVSLSNSDSIYSCGDECDLDSDGADHFWSDPGPSIAQQPAAPVVAASAASAVASAAPAIVQSAQASQYPGIPSLYLGRPAIDERIGSGFTRVTMPGASMR